MKRFLSNTDNYDIIPKDALHLNKKNTIYIMPEETNICPIHNCNMEIKVMSFGTKYKDTFHFCKQCNKLIVSQKQATAIRKINNKLIQKTDFKLLKD